jgi:hypothetical protein
MTDGLVAQWRSRAEQMDASAKAYNGRCMTTKGVQMMVRAKEVRKCADELEQWLNEQGDIATPSDS